ncbi:MAG: lysine 2,3-aminomutase [Myxococcales bacterium]|nr:lysine 2,3-aminomutase [Myxococcales bacterium]
MNPPRPERWAHVPEHTWNDWTWQQQNRLTRLPELEAAFRLTPEERRAFEASAASFRVSITPYYASLIDPDDPSCPIRQQAIPQLGELEVFDFEHRDPLAEEQHMPVPGITHRYPDRVLFYVIHHCPVYCRHCTRKRKVSDPTTAAALRQIEEGIAYIARTPAVRDVLLSGGDPLSLSDARLDMILERLLAIEHVDLVRIGTRNPVTLPQRITPALAEVLRRHRPVYVHTHFNHPRECTPEAARALNLLADAGCVLGNQMVLLRGVNDDPELVVTLNRWLLRQRCRPYYMFQCDMAQGITHLRTPLSTGLKIIDRLRGHCSGMAVPHFVVDLPGGGGKISLLPEYLQGRDGPWVTFRNYQGDLYRFYDVPEG